MKVHYDSELDAFAIHLDPSEKIIESEEVLPGVIVDFNEKEQIVGIEILRAKGTLSASVHTNLRRQAQS